MLCRSLFFGSLLFGGARGGGRDLLQEASEVSLEVSKLCSIF